MSEFQNFCDVPVVSLDELVGAGDMKLDAYRETRDQIRARIKERFDFS